MKVTILYGTNSGGTEEAVGLVADTLTRKGHEVEVVRAGHADPASIAGRDLIILASCTWERIEDGKRLEGQLQEDMHRFAVHMKDTPMQGQAFAVIGVGDSRYTEFCAAAGHLEALVQEVGGVLKFPTLRIDQYYFHLPESRKAVQAWAEQIQ